MNLFADNRAQQPDTDPIYLSCDASLDEGEAIIEAQFMPGIASSGTEHFMQLDREEAELLRKLIQGSINADAAEGAWSESDPRERLLVRLERLLGYKARPRLLVGTPLAEGIRVRLTRDVERYPHFVAPKGATGEITESSREIVSVRLDEDLPGSEAWENEVHWYPENGDDAAADIAPIDEDRAATIRGRKEDDYQRYGGAQPEAGDPDGRTMIDRVLNGRDMVALAYTGTGYLAYEAYEEGLVDALANLTHFARRYEIDFDAALEDARGHAAAEATTAWEEVPTV